MCHWCLLRFWMCVSMPLIVRKKPWLRKWFWHNQIVSTTTIPFLSPLSFLLYFFISNINAVTNMSLICGFDQTHVVPPWWPEPCPLIHFVLWFYGNNSNKPVSCNVVCSSRPAKSSTHPFPLIKRINIVPQALSYCLMPIMSWDTNTYQSEHFIQSWT